MKRRDVIGMLENYKHMFKKNIDDKTKHVVWGQQIMLERILEEDTRDYDHDILIQRIWHYATIQPYHTFRWLFDPTPLEIEESLESWKLLNMAFLLC